MLPTIYSNSLTGKEIAMNFFTARDLRTIPKSIWHALDNSGEVVITNNGKPTALMLNISEDNFDQVVRAVRQARAMLAFNHLRGQTAERGFMSEVDIEAEIAAARREA
jgi:PHD/YefM family antitoxin component YafN of YafNO toxin-antitoxin module